MKKSFVYILLVVFFTQCNPFEKKQSQNLNISKQIEDIKNQMAPDPRDHVWEIEFELKKDTLKFKGTTDLPEAKEKLFSKFTNDFFIVDSIRILPLQEFKNKAGVIRLSVANLRSKPKHSAELSSQMLMGMPVKILEFKKGFYRIRTTEGYLGWTEPASIQIMNKSEFEQWLSKPKAIVNIPYVQLTENPYYESKQVSDAVLNNVFILLNRGEFFSRIQLPDGRTAYIDNNAYYPLEEWELLSDKLFNINDLINVVQKDYLGIPYLWGGTSVKGMDCSGFTKNLFHSFNLLLPRDASQQYRYGKEIKLNDSLSHLQPGDLLFFGKKLPGNQKKITHVALYAGNGRIFHATGEIKEESLFDNDSLYNEARKKSLLGAKRYFGYFDRTVYKFYTKDALKIYFPD